MLFAVVFIFSLCMTVHNCYTAVEFSLLSYNYVSSSGIIAKKINDQKPASLKIKLTHKIPSKGLI